MEGFDSGGLFPGTSDLSIYWHGPLSPEAEASIARANERGQQVHVVEVKYSSEEIWHFATSLAQALSTEGISLSGFATNRANDEIALSGPELSVDADLQGQVLAIASQIVPNDVAVTFVPAEIDGGTYDSRHADSGNPTPGGELDIDGDKCTQGLGTTRAGYGDYLLTAAHCVGFDNGVDVDIPSNTHSGYSTFTSTLFGAPNTVGNPSHQVDATLISYVYDGASIDAKMYYGSNTTSTKIDIDDTGNIPYDTPLCSSGSATGLNCGFMRTGGQSRQCASSSGGTCVASVDIVRVDSPDEILMFGAGDSGDPVYYLDGGQRIVVAFVQGYGGPAITCGSANIYDSTYPCSEVNGRVSRIKQHFAGHEDELRHL